MYIFNLPLVTPHPLPATRHPPPATRHPPPAEKSCRHFNGDDQWHRIYDRACLI